MNIYNSEEDKFRKQRSWTFVWSKGQDSYVGGVGGRCGCPAVCVLCLVSGGKGINLAGTWRPCRYFHAPSAYRRACGLVNKVTLGLDFYYYFRSCPIHPLHQPRPKIEPSGPSVVHLRPVSPLTFVFGPYLCASGWRGTGAPPQGRESLLAEIFTHRSTTTGHCTDVGGQISVHVLRP